MSLSLNDKQCEAVETTDGPVLVIAGAGSGKTRVLTERITHLVRDKHVAPESIIAFTFTNRAAREMRERLEKAVPGISTRLWVGTFHGTGVKILKGHGERIGISRYFSIYDARDSLELIKDIISRAGHEGHVLRSPRNIQDRISRWKEELMTPEFALQQVGDNIERRIANVYREYEKGLLRAKALDFDDLIVRVVELFTRHEDVKNHYADRFRYVLVDEFQDTNPTQMAMIDALASVHGNLFVVGDDDQSIYSWRGARVEHILNFEELYSGTRVIRLEQNYRSTQTILDAANEVIANNRGRKGKNLWTEGERGERVTVIASMDEEAEAMNVLHIVKTLVDEGFELRDMAILYRTNAQSRALEDVLKLGSLPYQIIGSVRFYERAEVRDILAYCKLVANPDDDVSLKRILNVPKRGLGKTTYDRLSALAASRETSVMQTLRSGSFDLASAQTKRIATFVQLYDRLELLARTEDAPRVIEEIIEATEYRKYLREAYPDPDVRTENIDELVSAAESYTENQDDRLMRAFLEEIALVADVDSLNTDLGQLTLMTLHNAKGLEFECVFITGLEERLFPHANSMDDPAQLEEERRLFYVGMTRAGKRLFCSYANMRRRMGVIEGGMPSRFLFELPQELLGGAVESIEAHRGGRLKAGDFIASDFVAGDFVSGGYKASGSQAPAKEIEDYSQEELVYHVGMRVAHQDFGRGVVRRVEGSGENLRVTVIFDGGGERKFLAHYAPMQPL